MISTSRPKKNSNFVYDHVNGDTQLLNLRTVSFTHIKELRSKCSNNISVGISSLCD